MHASAHNLAASEVSQVERCRDRDPDAWRDLYETYLPTVFRLAERMGVPAGDIPDVCQEIFIRVLRGLRGFRGEARLSTWVHRIALNEIMRAQRASSVRRFLPGFLNQGADRASPQPDSFVESSEAYRELLAILAGMKPRSRVVFVLYELDGMPLDRIAEVISRSPDTTKSRLRAARREFDKIRRRRAGVAARGGSAT